MGQGPSGSGRPIAGLPDRQGCARPNIKVRTVTPPVSIAGCMRFVDGGASRSSARVVRSNALHLGFEEDARVRVPDARQQQALRLRRAAGHDHLDAQLKNNLALFS